MGSRFCGDRCKILIRLELKVKILSAKDLGAILPDKGEISVNASVNTREGIAV